MARTAFYLFLVMSILLASHPPNGARAEHSEGTCAQTMSLQMRPTTVTFSGKTAKVSGTINDPLNITLRQHAPLERIELDSPGGSLFVAWELPKLAKHIVLTGEVASAAAMLATEAENVCIDATSVTELHFHAVHGYDCTTKTFSVNAFWTEDFIESLRSPLRERLHSLASDILITVPVEEFFRSYPDRRC